MSVTRKSRPTSKNQK